jgi:hypothetical protein
MTENFFKLPNWVIGGNIELTPYEIAACAVIGRHRSNATGESFPGMALIAKQAGMSKPTAIAAVKSLREKGVISVRIEGESHGQKFHYRFIETQETGSCGLPVTEETGKRDDTKPVNHVYPNKTNNKTSFNKRGNDPLPTKQDGQVSENEIPEGMDSLQYARGLLEHCNIDRA